MDGEDLRRWRRGMGISQARLGELLSVPQQTVARWETGKHRVEHGRIMALALSYLGQYPDAVKSGDGVAPTVLLGQERADGEGE